MVISQTELYNVRIPRITFRRKLSEFKSTKYFQFWDQIQINDKSKLKAICCYTANSVKTSVKTCRWVLAWFRLPLQIPYLFLIRRVNAALFMRHVSAEKYAENLAIAGHECRSQSDTNKNCKTYTKNTTKRTLTKIVTEKKGKKMFWWRYLPATLTCTFVNISFQKNVSCTGRDWV